MNEEKMNYFESFLYNLLCNAFRSLSIESMRFIDNFIDIREVMFKAWNDVYHEKENKS